jgi:hypothetical protein
MIDTTASPLDGVADAREPWVVMARALAGHKQRCADCPFTPNGCADRRTLELAEEDAWRALDVAMRAAR